MGEGLKRASLAAKRTRYPGTPDPAVGQVWEDCDKRNPGREVRIDSIRDGFAHCAIVAGAGNVGRKSSINLDRFLPTSTGYRYVRTETTHALRRELGEPQVTGQCENCGMTNVSESDPCVYVERP